MNDILKGTIGVLIQILLAIVGLLFMFGGMIACIASRNAFGFFFVLLGLICWAAIGGIKYWLGKVVRIR